MSAESESDVSGAICCLRFFLDRECEGRVGAGHCFPHTGAGGAWRPWGRVDRVG